jgi:hypothetical protein
VLLLLLCVWAAGAGWGASADCGKANVQFRGVDLARARWFVSDRVPPTASADDVTSHATPTSPLTLFQLRNTDSLTLFSIIEVPGQTSYGAELTIGDIDGDDETYFNGQIIGKTSGRGVSDTGNSRSYYIPPTVFVEGRNVLAIQLRGCFGRPQAGIRREPLTIGFVPRPPEGRELPVRPSVVPAISVAEARAAISAVDPESSGALLLGKRPAFGRFGLLFGDGLPAVAEVSPTAIRNRFGPAFRVQLDSVANTEIAREKNDAGIDGWHKTVRVQGLFRGTPVRYSVSWHLYYPGATIALEEGQALVLRVAAGQDEVVALPLAPAELARLTGGRPDPSTSVFLFFSRSERTSPAVVIVTGGAANLTQMGERIDLAVAQLPKSKQTPRLWVFYPLGIRGVVPPRKMDSWRAVAAAFDAAGDTTAALCRWLRIGGHWPTATDEYFRVAADQSSVRIYQLARYQNVFASESGLEPLLVLPPQLAFARRTLDYPVRTGLTTDTGVLCFTGELFAQDPAESTAPLSAAAGMRSRQKSRRQPSAPLTWAWYYDLPVPPLDERGLLNVPEQDDLKELLDADDVTTFASTIAASGVDVLYKGRTQAWQAYSLLKPEKREALATNTRTVVPAYLDSGKWYDSVEPFSALRFWWSYFIEGPYFDRYDQDWGNGLSLYGLYTAVKYMGEWEWVARHWDAVERMFSWFAVTDDWEWMRASNGVHGHGTGAGDCTNAAYVGVLSYAKLARETGRTEEFNYGLYAAARAALPTLTRFVYNDFADEQGLKEPARLVVGFYEGQGFLQGELDRYPWNVTSLISGNGVQPEIFDLLARYAERPVVAYEREFAAAYPDWFEGSYTYPFRTLYGNNSGYITLPHIYLRARLALDGPADLRDYLKSARANNYLWWLAPPVIAELAQPRQRAYVANWGKCAFLGGNIVRLDRNRLRVEVQFDNRYPPDTVELVLPRAPRRVEINDGPVAIPDLKAAGLRLQVRLRKPGINLLTILL